MEDNRVAEKLDKIDAAMTSILVEQGKMTQSMSTLTENMKTNTDTINARNLVIDDHGTRLTKIEASMKILAWISGIIAVVVAARIIAILNGL